MVAFSMKTPSKSSEKTNPANIYNINCNITKSTRISEQASCKRFDYLVSKKKKYYDDEHNNYHGLNTSGKILLYDKLKIRDLLSRDIWGRE